MRDSNFDRLLHRYLHNELSPEEAIKFSAWLDLLERENAQDLELSEEAKERLFQNITNNIHSVDEVVKLYPRKSFVKKLISKPWIQVAATVLMLLLITLAGREFFANIGSESKEKMILNDGTIVWIDESSEFSYYEKGGSRYATFAGEALFEVAKNPKSPFTISCGTINVRVLGTSFTLKATSEQVELNVLTGKVNLSSVSDKIGVDVLPLESIVYSGTGKLKRTTVGAAVIESVAHNLEYNMKFQAASMDQVIRGISKKFDVTIVVKNQELNKCHISADFTDHTLEETLTIIAEMLNVKYIITDKQVELSGAGC